MAIPIWALAAAILRSEAAMSGRRSRSCDGTPTGTGGGIAFEGLDGNRKAGRRGADQDRDGVFELCARDAQIGAGGLRALQRVLCLNERKSDRPRRFRSERGSGPRTSGRRRRFRRKLSARRPDREVRRKRPPGWPARSGARFRGRRHSTARCIAPGEWCCEPCPKDPAPRRLAAGRV